ncbi:unnamed protein product, partial [Phaeothamnion confervicola]
DARGNLQGVVWIGTDVTSESAAKSAAKESEERYRDLFEHSTDLIHIASPEGKLLFTNPAWQKAAGYTAREATELNVSDVIHPEDRERMALLRARIRTGEDVGPISARILRKDGGEVWVEGRVSVRIEDGKFISTRGIFRDITAARQTEIALDRLHREHSQILDTIGEGIYRITPDGITTYANPACAKMMGYRHDELIGRDMHTLLHYAHEDGSAYPTSECPIHSTSRDGITRRVTKEVFWHKNGTAIPVEYICSPLEIDGVQQGVVVVCRDITERLVAKRTKDE